MGDLNYRIDLSGEEVRKYIKETPNLAVLLANDQLNQQKEAKEAFSNYKERFISSLSSVNIFKN